MTTLEIHIPLSLIARLDGWLLLTSLVVLSFTLWKFSQSPGYIRRMKEKNDHN